MGKMTLAGALSEVFDSKPAPIKWAYKSPKEWQGKFDIEELSMSITMTKESGDTDTWDIGFGVSPMRSRVSKKMYDMIKKKGGHSILGTGNQGKVFSTVMNAIKYFASKVKPKKITFTASEISRMKLYKRMVIKFAPSLGYKPIMTGDYFELERIKK